MTPKWGMESLLRSGLPQTRSKECPSKDNSCSLCSLVSGEGFAPSRTGKPFCPTQTMIHQ